MTNLEIKDIPKFQYISQLMKVCHFEQGQAKNLHIFRRECIPSCTLVHNIDIKKWEVFREEIESTYEWDLLDRVVWEELDTKSVRYKIHYTYFKCGLTISYSSLEDQVIMYYDIRSDQAAVEKLKKRIPDLIKSKSDRNIGFIQLFRGNLTVAFKDFKPHTENFTEYLGEDLKEFKQEMIDSLNDKEKSGLVLLHGAPGTGKTSFIKTILGAVERRAIYLTPGYANSLTSPELLSLLMDYPSSVLIIEDAEAVLMKRQGDNSNAVSNLLNLTDGFPADYLKLKIICTFNTSLNDIDPALLREGRLTGIHEFKKLEAEEANRLAKHLGKEEEVHHPMTLAEVCNLESFTKPVLKTIGY